MSLCPFLVSYLLNPPVPENCHGMTYIANLLSAVFDAYKYPAAFLFWPMYAYVEQSFIYRCYGSVFVRVYVHSQILSVITY